MAFGGGFAQGFTSGFGAVDEAIRTQELITQKKEENRLLTAKSVFDKAFDVFKFYEDTANQLAGTEEGQRAFAEGSAFRQQFQQAIDLANKTAPQLGLPPNFGDMAGQAILQRLSVAPQFEGASPLGKLLQDRENLPEGSPERAQLDEAIKQEIENDPNTIVVHARAPNGDEVTLLVDKTTGATVAEIGRGPTVQFQPVELPASKQQQIQERADLLQQGVEQIDIALALPEGSFGSVATISRGIREVLRVGGELTKAGVPKEIAAPLTALADLGEKMIDSAIQEGRLDPETAQELLRSDLTEAQVLETRLAFLVANALQPEGRLLKDSINAAREMTNLSGIFTSEKTARERLSTIRNILVRSQGGLKGSAEVGKSKGNKRFRFNPETDMLEPIQ